MIYLLFVQYMKHRTKILQERWEYDLKCDLGWPLSTLNHLNFCILRCLVHLRNWWSWRLQFLCRGWMCKSQPTDDKPSLIGCGQVMWPIKHFGCSSHITGTAKTKVVKFCTHVGYINSSNDISLTKGAW